MRELWDVGTPEAKREAAEIAKDAAPYVHRKHRSNNQGGPTFCRGARQLSIEEWQLTYGPQGALEDKSAVE